MPIDVYQHENHKFSNLGLQLRLPVDMVPQGQYSRLNNVVPDIEGELETRAGTDSLGTVAADQPVHTLFRLNQQPNSGVPSQRFLGAGAFLYSQILPGGTPGNLPTQYDGGPLSIIDFRFDFDSASWAIIANSAAMRKIRVRANAGGIISPYLDWPLGEPPPTIAATATAGSSGNLNNGSGPGYDWRYTFVNSLLNSESNPSPVTLPGGTTLQYPTVNVNPETGTLPATTLLVGPKAQPWSFAGGINLTYSYGLNDGTSPVVYSQPLAPGQLIKIAYLSGTVKCSDSRPHVNGAGQASYITDGQGGSTGTFFPTKYMPTSQLGLGGLCGAFVDNSGNVIMPLSIGLGATFVVPIGATRIQFGIDDDRYVDNTDSGFTISVAGVPPGPCANPTNAYDGDPTTFATFVATSFPPTSQSCLFKGWTTVGTITGLQLNVDSEVLLTGGGGVNDVQTFIEYSIDNGGTWSVLYSIYGVRGRTTDTVNFAVGVDPSQVQLRAIVVGNGKSGSTYTMTMRLYDMWLVSLAGAAETLALTNQEAVLCVQPPNFAGYGEDTIRLYRRGGSLTDTWYQVGDFLFSTLSAGTCGSGLLEIIDNVADADLGVAIPLDNDMPVTGIQNLNTPLSFIWGQFDRRVLGCGEPSRPDAVYFSKQGNADQWPPQNWVTVSTPSDPMQAGCVYNTRCFAFSKERMYELVPGLQSGVTFSPFPTPCTHGLISPWGLCSYDRVYFVSKDGVYATTGGPEVSIVENDIKPLFPTKDGPGRSIHGYEAVDLSQPSFIRLSAHNDEVYFTYKGTDTGTLQTLVYDIRKNRWRAAQYTPPALTFYSEPGTQSSLLLGGSDGDFYQTTFGTDNGQPIPVLLRTGAHDQGTPLSQKEYGNVVFDLDPGGADDTNPVIITPYINGERVAESAINVTGTGRQQVPLSLNDIFAYNLEFEVSWNRTDAGVSGTPVVPVLYQYDILWKPEPTRLTHWEARENSYNMAGYGHLRDGYLGLRSDTTSILSFYLDGSATPFYSVTLASTAGQRKKVFFALPANKFKVVRITLNSTSASIPFRLYEQDCEFRLKQWLSPLGYRTIPMIGAESQFASAAWTSQLLGGGGGGQ
jgi:hypothetical protein